MGIDPEKLLVLFVIALVVLGPERLPRMARSLGRGLAELRKYTSTVQREVDNVLAEPRSLVRSALEESDLAPLAGTLRYIDAPYRPKAPAKAPALSAAEGEPAGTVAGEAARSAAAEDAIPGGVAASNGQSATAGEAWAPSGGAMLGAPVPDDPSFN